MTGIAAWSLLGLGMKAGSVVVGSSGVRAALQRDELVLVVVAGNHSERTADKVLRLANGRGIPSLVGPCAEDLGKSVGRGAVQAIGVRDSRLAAGMQAHAAEDGR